MPEILLTKAAEEKLCAIYAEFKAKEMAGESRESARRFTLGPDEELDIFRELHKAKFIKQLDWPHFELKYAAIIYMENK